MDECMYVYVDGSGRVGVVICVFVLIQETDDGKF